MKVVHYGGRSEDGHRLERTICTRETEKAIFVEIEGHNDLWVPKSVVDDDSEVYAKGHQGTLVVKRWWAAKQGLV
jgi:hypothetical protein